ncbi:biotin--[acetyl-CoA-carboxylase] ligase [Marinoscillum furvescens]|uniref:biotin--[biotin carboxyl-carrier protein] ligase n=1 Tax=Marinoscillum furvescens DSM 4134 TaxID=1122208 RepID=A0A3D9L4W3_MARFU|nr:biotin--[acetyl-CoA-carboxylase] ligase [Marinoscillum furvescens]RED99522.1 BirA family biotin operon repressor/biotin-[acetyl-CoA-carboxylase] ligase [Marinoscillum furvescens DSM 4134]
MHKYFAKTLFLAKKIEFLPECQSTNDELMRRARQGTVSEGFLLWADHQTGGKGQRGNTWVSPKGQNLLFSLLLKPRKLLPKEAYLINVLAGLAVHEALEKFLDLKNVSLKWPNDIYLGGKKAGGILLEAGVTNSTIDKLVIGIGLNVNQTDFELDTATSLKGVMGYDVNREELLEQIICALERYYLLLNAGSKDTILRKYHDVMMWRGEVHWFRSGDEDFAGEIIGIDQQGRLVVKTNEQTRRFEVKEISFVR